MAETHCIPIIDITRNSLNSETVYKKLILRHMAAARSFNVRLRKEALKKKREASANLKCPHSPPAKSSRASSSLKMTDKNVQVKPLSKVASANLKCPHSVPAKSSRASSSLKMTDKNVQIKPLSKVASANLKCPHSAPAKLSRASSSLKMTDKNVQVKPLSKVASANLKCPHSAPAKSSRTSSSLKMTDKNVQVKPLSKVATIPNGKVSPSAPVAKALTTPRNNQKKVSNVEPFRSVQSGKKVLTVGVPKSRVVSSKALVFPSPKKVIQIKNSMELKTPMRALSSLPVKKNEEGGSKSSSLKMTDKNVQVKPLSKVAATPNGKVRPSAPVAKALTTPRNNQKKVSNVEPFRSVQSSKKVLTVGVPKSRVVSSKALVFPSPKKVIKIKNSMELKTPMRALCSLPVKKNEEAGSKSLPVTASKKQLRGREVKSRVFDFLSSNDRKEPETKSMSCLTLKQNSSSTTTVTDERGILKEANLDRKSLSPLKETAVKGGGTATRKHQNTDYYSSCDEKSRPKTQENQSGGIQIDNFSCKVQRKVSSTTPFKNDPRPKLEKPNDVNDKFKRKSEMTQRKVLRPQSALPRKKEKAIIATKLSVIIEKPSDIIVKPKAAKPRKALTVPIEPKFHRLHVPKDCNNSKRT